MVGRDSLHRNGGADANFDYENAHVKKFFFFTNPRRTEGWHLENPFRLYLSAYCPLKAKFREMKENRTQIKSHDKIVNFKNSTWQMAVILRMVILLDLSRK